MTNDLQNSKVNYVNNIINRYKTLGDLNELTKNELIDLNDFVFYMLCSRIKFCKDQILTLIVL